MDPRVARFIERHHVDAAQAARDDVRDYLGLSPEATWPHIVAACRLAAWCRDAGTRGPRDDDEDPPHPSYAAIVARLRAKGP